MRKKKTIIAAYHRPIKVRLTDSVDTILLQINRIAGTQFTTIKKPIELLKEMPALKIANKGFYTNARVKLKVNSKFEVASTDEILERQSMFMRGLIDENQEAIKNLAFEKLNERNRKTEARKTTTKKKGVTEEIQNLAEYIRTNRIILWVMLIPVFLLLLLLTIYFLNN
jgi:hypothetical protein